MPVGHSSLHKELADELCTIGLQPATRSWYFTKDEIDNHSPSRKDGIDRVSESLMRKSFCSFLKDLSMKLRVSPVTAATAMMFCHRFYMRQSLAKNDWQTIATACMFLACKVEDNPHPLRDVVVVAYEIIYKWDPSASEKIRQREVYHKQKELILVAEHLLLVTIAFDMSIQHPFKPLVDALKRLKISNNDVAKAAWNLLNEWLRTTLCLQYKPHYIAAASLSVAAKLLNFKLPVQDGMAWWMQFDVSPKQLEEVTQQMLRYFKNDGKQKVAPSRTNGTKAAPKVECGTSQSTEYSVQSGLTDRSDIKEGAPMDCRVPEPSRINGTKAAHNVECGTSQTTEYSLQSGLTVGSDMKEDAPVNSRIPKPPSHKNSPSHTTKAYQVMSKEASEYQSSDCSEICSLMDNETAHTSSMKTQVDDASKLDVGRLRGAFEKAKRIKSAKNRVLQAEDEGNSDLFIERELEKGVELGYVAASKKRKVVLD
ncbi:cyclin-T1-3-like [Silene latifolia]|uniref:cyclin-T1-3-like n=1 Tax=Silene latifolia TaxID=37657 RepID=UPI003D779707